jgi:hypothetical protein
MAAWPLCQKEENFAMFWFGIFGWFMGAFLKFVVFLEAVFET